MNKTWILVVIAAFFEAVWVAGLKYADNFLAWTLTAVIIVLSFVVLIYASRKLPTSTVYAVFVGLGTACTVVSEMLFFGEPFRWGKIVLIVLLLIGIIGLKLVTPVSGEKTQRVGDDAA